MNLTLYRLISFVILIPLFFTSCKKESSNPTAPQQSGSLIRKTKLSGVVKIPSGSNISTNDIRVLSIASTDSVKNDGSFTITVPQSESYQVIVLRSKSKGSPLLFGLYDPNSKSLIANDSSTVISLLLLNPLLIYASVEQKAQYVQAALQQPGFSDLLSSLNNGYQSDASTALDYKTHPDLYQKLGELMRATLSSFGSKENIHNTQGILTTPPFITDLPGPYVGFVNPTHVTYGARISPTAGNDNTITIARTQTILSFQLGWPPVFVTPPETTKYDLGDGTFNVDMEKGPDFSKFADWNDPAGRATVFNTGDAVVYIISLAVQIPGINDDLLAKLPKYITISADDASALALDLDRGDVSGVINDFGGILESNSQAIALWLWQANPAFDINGYLSAIADVVGDVSFVFKVLGVANEDVPFFYDLITAQSPIVCDISQTNDILGPVTTNNPPTAQFTISPPAGIISTIFSLDASSSTDDHDINLLFRWDFESDGIWDVDWNSNPITSHTYSKKGAYSITLEVKDSQGLIGRITHTLSVGGGAGTANHIKIFQDDLPWNSNAMTNVLTDLGFTAGKGANTYEMLPSDSMATVSLTPGVDLIILSNDQIQQFYINYAANEVRFSNFINAGGSLYWEACDNGWSNGSMSSAGVVLPANVQTTFYLDFYNYVVNNNLPLVNGLPDTLYHNFASHEEFTNIQDGTTDYFLDDNGQPTLIEFNYGGGWVIMTGQPLEHIYDYVYSNGAPAMRNLLPRILAYFTGHALPKTIHPLGVLASAPRPSHIGNIVHK